MSELTCKKCGLERELGRRLCRACNLERLKEIAKAKPRYVYDKTCDACKVEFKAWRKVTKLCPKCQSDSHKWKPKATNSYIMSNIPGRTQHRDIAESLLGRKLSTNEVVHHIDCNPKNNTLANLLIISRSMHLKLHHFLDAQRVILEKSGNENFENCWDTLIAPMTTTWLETANVKVIKLWEIGQSAAEPLKDNSHGEGSETMHEAPDHSVEGEEIVQTTTV